MSVEHELSLLLTPARTALQRIPAEIREPLMEALDAARPVLDLAAAQARAAEARGITARDAARIAQARADRIEAELDLAIARERERWIVLADAVERADDIDADMLVRALDIDGSLTDPDTFETWMLDDGAVLTLGVPREAATMSGDGERIAGIARPLLAAPLDARATAALLARTATPDALVNASACGAVVIHDDGSQAVLLGDGTAVIDGGGCLQRAAAADGHAHVLMTRRWASGAPPVMLPSARAAYAAAQAARDAPALGAPETFGAHALFGATIPVSEDASVRTLIDAVRDVARASGDTRTAAAFRLAYLTLRVHVFAGEPVAGHEMPESMIDVGRVRWCERTQRPIVWLPLHDQDPDIVGGGDRAWTDDPPAFGATWHDQSPGLRLDPNWHARIVADPAHDDLLCVTPDGRWWDLAVSLEAIVLARRAHVDGWLRALEQFEIQMTATIDAAERQQQDVKDTDGPSELTR